MLNNTMLKYLFTAKFEDGSTIEQTQADLSSMNPEKSAFYDVLNHKSKLKSFALRHGEDEIALDLDTLTFTRNGAIEEQGDANLTDKRLIYFREVTLTFPQGIQDIVFIIGWQANDSEGKNHQKVIRLN